MVEVLGLRHDARFRQRDTAASLNHAFHPLARLRRDCTEVHGVASAVRQPLEHLPAAFRVHPAAPAHPTTAATRTTPAEPALVATAGLAEAAATWTTPAKSALIAATGLTTAKATSTAEATAARLTTTAAGLAETAAARLTTAEATTGWTTAKATSTAEATAARLTTAVGLTGTAATGLTEAGGVKAAAALTTLTAFATAELGRGWGRVEQDDQAEHPGEREALLPHGTPQMRAEWVNGDTNPNVAHVSRCIR
ncbi:hypothetical protein R5W24_003144 [Gemmata sp. JC717]|uniref:hypothetical protein n=1 Tax=Gemmata algarum TaxID=2975278 RepID=UPI0021BBB641|nr:hypothetical protein [Gemmata algarum]MDY3554027.1 hypothetical protein [Gemmata algarum]